MATESTQIRISIGLSITLVGFAVVGGMTLAGIRSLQDDMQELKMVRNEVVRDVSNLKKDVSYLQDRVGRIEKLGGYEPHAGDGKAFTSDLATDNFRKK